MSCQCSSGSVCQCGEDVLTLPVGAQGLPGGPGPTGPDGATGATGVAGTNGAQGATTCFKLTADWNASAGGAYIPVTGATLTAAGMLADVYEIDANLNVDPTATAEDCDFVWDIWYWDGTNSLYIDAVTAGYITSVTVNTIGNISVITNVSGLFRIAIIG